MELWSPDWPGTHFVHQTGLELTGNHPPPPPDCWDYTRTPMPSILIFLETGFHVAETSFLLVSDLVSSKG